MIPISGTIRNAVKLAQLDNKWQQKKQSGKIFEKETDPQMRMLKQYQEDLQKMRKSNEMSSITAKMKAGEDLTPEEIEYLQKNHPDIYREYMEIKGEKEAYERQLKRCKTKEEAERLKVNKMNGILAQAKSVMNNPNIPKGAKVGIMEKLLMKTMGIEKVHRLFVESGQYAELPTDEEYAEEKRQELEEASPLEEESTEEENVKEDSKPKEETIAEQLQEENLSEKDNFSKENAIEKQLEEDVLSDEKKETKKVHKQKKSHTASSVKELSMKADIAFKETKSELTSFLEKNAKGGCGYLDVHC